jgi:hypothetical protein
MDRKWSECCLAKSKKEIGNNKELLNSLGPQMALTASRDCASPLIVPVGVFNTGDE